MRGAVIATFGGVLEVRRVFRHKAFEEFLEIPPRGRVGVFHHDETAARMPNEDGDRARPDSARRDRGGHLGSDLAGSLAAGGDGEIRGMDTHRTRSPTPLPLRLDLLEEQRVAALRVVKKFGLRLEGIRIARKAFPQLFRGRIVKEGNILIEIRRD